MGHRATREWGGKDKGPVSKRELCVLFCKEQRAIKVSEEDTDKGQSRVSEFCWGYRWRHGFRAGRLGWGAGSRLRDSLGR